MMFWSIMSMIFVLLVTGVVIWRSYFVQYFPMQAVRYSLLVHAAADTIPIHAILTHVYIASWVKGSIKGMIERKVSRRWVKKHHPRQYCKIEKAEVKKGNEEGI